MTTHNAHSDAALRLALSREQAKIELPPSFTAATMSAIVSTPKPRLLSLHRVVKAVTSVAAAIVMLIALRSAIITEATSRATSLQLALYEGSFTEQDGRRIYALDLIATDINDALLLADLAEASVPTVSMANEAEQAILDAAAAMHLPTDVAQLIAN